MTETIGILTGPTATGKTKIALEFATRLAPRLEIINADSLLVYRGMDIGTAKPSKSEMQLAPHHLIDIRDPDQPFTAGEFCRSVQKCITDIHQRKNRALIVGGTGFYLKALLFGLWKAPPSDLALRESLNSNANDELYSELLRSDPPTAHRIGPNDRYRLIRAVELLRLTGTTPSQLEAEQSSEPDPRFHLWILDRDNNELHPRIHQRSRQMIQDGLVQEYETLVGRFPSSRALAAIGYAQVRDYLAGTSPSGRKIRPGLDGLCDEVELATRQLVKRQRTWFRNQAKEVPNSHWFYLDQDLPLLEEAFKSVYGESHGKA